MKADEVVGSRYRLIAPIASGGMGTVWRARHVELDSDVAVKVMSDALLRAPTALARFQREARAAAQLKSPHVVQVFDYGVHEGKPYLAMELLAGEDLKSYLDRNGALPLGRAAQIVDALAKALRLAHAAGIVHRDLKPANVFLQQSGGDEIVKILDFGIAKDLAPQPDALRTSTSTVVGSPLYMSPEQVRGSEVDHRTDLWSLAVVAFEMVTGRQPFEGASLGDVFARIVADDIPRASTVLAGLPPSIDAFFARALSRKPAERPADATELADSFRAAIEGAAAREATTQLVAAFAPRVARDAPTLGDDVGAAALDPASTSGSQPPPPEMPSAAPARTAGLRPESTSDLGSARTVATGAPSARPVDLDVKRLGRLGRLAALGVVLAGGVGALMVAAPWGQGGQAEPPAPASSVAPAAEPSGGASAAGIQPREASPLVEPAPPGSEAAPPPSASAPPSAPASASAMPAPTTAPRPGAAARPPGRPATSTAPPARTAIATDPIFGLPLPQP